jgi:transposase
LSPEQIARLALGQAKQKIAQLTEALAGHCMRDHERFLIRSSLRHLACLQEETEEMDTEILRRMHTAPFQESLLLLQTIPGIGQLAAASILAETGTDLSTFPTAEKIASWAGLCPGNRESAGTRKGSQTTKGNPHLRSTLVHSAWAATRKRDSIFQLRFCELAPRRGQKRAIVAIAHQMLTVLYFMLKNNIPFRGTDTAPQKHRRLRRAHHHLRCLRRLGETVQVFGSLEDAPPTG